MALRLEMTSRTTTSVTLRIAGAGSAVTSAYYDIRNIVKQTAPRDTREVNGSVNYHIPGDGYYSVTMTFSGLSPGTSYSFAYELRPIGSFVRTQSYYFSTEDLPQPDPDPYVSNLSVSSVGTISATWSIGNSSYMRDSNSMAVYLSGRNNSTMNFMGYLSSYERSWSSGLDGNYNALVPNSQYTIWVYVYNRSGQSFGVSRTFTFTRPRPSNFNWTTSKVSGGNYNLTGYEWESLMSKVNEFRAYRGLVTRDLIGTVTGGSKSDLIVPTAASFNRVANAISDMTSVGVSVSSGQLISASHLNALRDRLNSIT